jgi:hypothetical protein
MRDDAIPLPLTHSLTHSLTREPHTRIDRKACKQVVPNRRSASNGGLCVCVHSLTHSLTHSPNPIHSSGASTITHKTGRLLLLLLHHSSTPATKAAAAAAATVMAAATLLFDQLSDLGDHLPAGVPGDEAGFCALVQGAAAGAVGDGSGSGSGSGSGGGPLPLLARSLIQRIRAAEAAAAAGGGDGGAAAMEEEDEVGVLGVWSRRASRAPRKDVTEVHPTDRSIDRSTHPPPHNRASRPSWRHAGALTRRGARWTCCRSWPRSCRCVLGGLVARTRVWILFGYSVKSRVWWVYRATDGSISWLIFSTHSTF